MFPPTTFNVPSPMPGMSVPGDPSSGNVVGLPGGVQPMALPTLHTFQALGAQGNLPATAIASLAGVLPQNLQLQLPAGTQQFAIPAGFDLLSQQQGQTINLAGLRLPVAASNVLTPQSTNVAELLRTLTGSGTPMPAASAPVQQAPQRSTTSNASGSAYASRHQAAEQRRRTRINERLESLRKLVPHAERANTACFLEEVIKYVAQLKERNEQLEAALRSIQGGAQPSIPYHNTLVAAAANAVPNSSDNSNVSLQPNSQAMLQAAQLLGLATTNINEQQQQQQHQSAPQGAIQNQASGGGMHTQAVQPGEPKRSRLGSSSGVLNTVEEEVATSSGSKEPATSANGLHDATSNGGAPATEVEQNHQTQSVGVSVPIQPNATSLSAQTQPTPMPALTPQQLQLLLAQAIQMQQEEQQRQLALQQQQQNVTVAAAGASEPLTSPAGKTGGTATSSAATENGTESSRQSGDENGVPLKKRKHAHQQS